MNSAIHKEECGEGTLKKFTILPNSSNENDLLKFIASEKVNIYNILNEALQQQKNIKWFLSLNIEFRKVDSEGVEIKTKPFFRSFCIISTNNVDLNLKIEHAIIKIFTCIQDFHREGSGWIFNKVLILDVCTAEYNPLHGSSFIELPKILQNKKAIVNVQNTDSKCFQWAILSALNTVPTSHPYRVSTYLSQTNLLNFEGISFPVTIQQVPLFEKQNKISVNIFGFDKEVYPLYITENRFDKHINLLMLADDTKTHYCWIKNLSRLLSDRTNHNGKQFFCN